MSTEKDGAAANGERESLRAELTAAISARQNAQESLARLQKQAHEERVALLSELGHWKQVCADYRVDAERLRRWRRLRQRIAPEGSFRHWTLTFIKGAAERVLGKGRKNPKKDNREYNALLLRCEYPDLDAAEDVSGFLCIRGWAWPRSAVERIQVFVDDLHAGNAFYGFERPDLLSFHPERGSDVHLGFSFRLDARKLGSGVHKLKILAIGENRESAVEGTINVIERQESEPRSQITYQPAIANNGRSPKIASRTFGPSTDESVIASVVIFARNQAEILAQSLPVIASQKTSFSFEIVGYDTESHDGTPQVFRRNGARVVSVRSHEFHHVKTRLQSLNETVGKFVVFLVGDAIPTDEHWLQALLNPLLDDPLVAATYSRQLPAAGCVPWEARDIYLGSPVVREVKEVDWSKPAEVENYRNHKWKFISFSDVSACYRREVLERLPVLEGLPEVEDQYWCKCLLESGYRIVLEPTSAVIHSHNHSVREVYMRQFRFGRCFAGFMDAQPEPLHTFFLAVTNEVTNDLFFIVNSPASWLTKSKWILQAPLMRFVKSYGWRQGLHKGGFKAEPSGNCSIVTETRQTVPAERSK